MEKHSELSGVASFKELEPLLVLMPDTLVAAATIYAGASFEGSDRIKFYSTDEVRETPASSIGRPRRKTGRGKPANAPKKKIIGQRWSMQPAGKDNATRVERQIDTQLQADRVILRSIRIRRDILFVIFDES